MREKRKHRPGQAQNKRPSGPVLWGFHAVCTAITNPKRRINRLLISESAASTIEEALKTATEQGIKRPAPERTPKETLDKTLPNGAVHQGVAAYVDGLEERDAHDLVASLAEGEKAVFLMLDQVTDPHNVGAIMRSAAAFGAQGIIMQDRHAPEMNGVLAKTASGAADVIPVALETNLNRCIEDLQGSGFFVIGLDERGDDIGTLPDYDRLVLVLGAEGSGLRRMVKEHCDALASLPTLGQIKSLNVSNAAAVALYATRPKS